MNWLGVFVLLSCTALIACAQVNRTRPTATTGAESPIPTASRDNVLWAAHLDDDGTTRVEYCPYMKVYVDLWPGNLRSVGGDPDSPDLTNRVLEVMGEGLLDHGFRHAELDEAYWTLEGKIAKPPNNSQVAFGSVRMRTFADFQGKPVRHALGMPGELRDYHWIFLQPVFFLDNFVRDLSNSFGEKLFPHAYHMCVDWKSGQLEEEARLERIREELVAEMERIRRERQRRQLEIEVDTPDRKSEQ